MYVLFYYVVIYYLGLLLSFLSFSKNIYGLSYKSTGKNKRKCSSSNNSYSNSNNCIVVVVVPFIKDGKFQL